jgi:hypothetical protein
MDNLVLGLLQDKFGYARMYVYVDVKLIMYVYLNFVWMDGSRCRCIDLFMSRFVCISTFIACY